jgi:hypothetical protein
VTRALLASGTAVVAATLLSLGCGYTVGGGTGRLLPADARTVAVATLANETREIGIEKRLALAIEREFAMRGTLRIAARPEEGDLVLSGTVRQAEDRPVAFNRNDEVLIYQTALAVDLELRRRTTGELLWQGRGLRGGGDYEAVAAVIVTTSPEFRRSTLNAEDLGGFTEVQLAETRRRQTLERIVATLARDVYDQIMEDF